MIILNATKVCKCKKKVNIKENVHVKYKKCIFNKKNIYI